MAVKRGSLPILPTVQSTDAPTPITGPTQSQTEPQAPVSRATRPVSPVRPVSRRTSAKRGLQTIEGPQFRPRQRTNVRGIGPVIRKAIAADTVDLTSTGVDNVKFKDLVSAFVSGDISGEVLAKAGAKKGKPGTRVFVLKPAIEQARLKKIKADKEEVKALNELIDKLTDAQAASAVDTATEGTLRLKGGSSPVDIIVDGKQFKILNTLDRILTGSTQEKRSDALVEKVLRLELASQMKNRLSKIEFSQLIADLGWDDVFDAEIREGRTDAELFGTSEISDTLAPTGLLPGIRQQQGVVFTDPAVQAYFERKQARLKQRDFFAVRVGVTPIFSAAIPLTAYLKTLKSATGKRLSKADFSKRFSNFVKSERGILDVDVSALKRGGGRTQPVPLETQLNVNIPKLKKLQTADPTRTAPSVPGKFDPDTFDPFRPLPSSVPADPLKIVKTHRTVRRIIEVPEKPTTPVKTSPRRRPDSTPDPIPEVKGKPFVKVDPAPEFSPVAPGAKPSTTKPTTPEVTPAPKTPTTPKTEPPTTPKTEPSKPKATPEPKPQPKPKTQTKKRVERDRSTGVFEGDVVTGAQVDAVARPQPLTSAQAAAQAKTSPLTSASPAAAAAAQPDPLVDPLIDPLQTPEPVPQPTPRITDTTTPPPPPGPKKTPPPRPPRRPLNPPIDFERKQKKKKVLIAVGDQFINVIGWRQGNVYIVKDLVTGEETTSSKPPAGINPGVTPRETLSVLRTGTKRPTQRELDRGAFRIKVDRRNINFTRI